MGTLMESSEVVLATLNGGTGNLHETTYDIRYIARVLFNCRNLVLADSIKKRIVRGVPYTYYTWADATIQWVDSRRVLGATIASKPLSLDYDCGIAVQDGSLGMDAFTFVRAAPNWCKSNPRYSRAEGNMVWELHDLLLAFPAASRSTMEGHPIQIGIVAESPKDLEDADLAPEHAQQAIDLCIQSILGGTNPRDIIADANKDDRRSR